MAEHAVENHVYASFVSFLDKFVEFGLGAEFGIDLEVVGAEIACGLESFATLAVCGIENGGHPYGVHAQVLDIVEGIDDAA